MASYRVLFRSEAEDQILRSYEWGVQFWGETEAQDWLRNVYKAVFHRLTTFPFSCPIAPESEDTDEVVRHYFVGRRYRILFKIEDDMVIVLQFVGPFGQQNEVD